MRCICVYCREDIQVKDPHLTWQLSFFCIWYDFLGWIRCQLWNDSSIKANGFKILKEKVAPPPAASATAASRDSFISAAVISASC